MHDRDSEDRDEFQMSLLPLPPWNHRFLWFPEILDSIPQVQGTVGNAIVFPANAIQSMTRSHLEEQSQTKIEQDKSGDESEILRDSYWRRRSSVRKEQAAGMSYEATRRRLGSRPRRAPRESIRGQRHDLSERGRLLVWSRLRALGVYRSRFA